MNLLAFLFRLSGWKINGCVPNNKKMVLCIAPHTSNWDFLVGKIAYSSIGKTANFLIKEEWLHTPIIGRWLRKHGGIGVNRAGKHALTDQLAAQFRSQATLHLAITPEGTRKRNPDWKLGFYYIALKAGVPILPIGIDYQKKEIIVMDLVQPTGDAEADLHHIQQLYAGIQARHPQQFAIRD